MAEFELQTAVLSGDGDDDDGYMTRHQRRRWAGFDRFFEDLFVYKCFPFLVDFSDECLTTWCRLFGLVVVGPFERK